MQDKKQKSDFVFAQPGSAVDVFFPAGLEREALRHETDLRSASEYRLPAFSARKPRRLKRDFIVNRSPRRIAEKIHTGTVWVNCWLVRDLRVPFGGMKASGVGREGGDEALRFFTEAKNICIAK